MNLIISRDEAAALRSELAKVIRDKAADQRINGWDVPELPALRRVWVQINDALSGKAEP